MDSNNYPHPWTQDQALTDRLLKLVDEEDWDLFGIAEDGVGSFVIDPVKAFGTSKVALANFKVKLSLSDAPANINEVLYRIVDLDSGAITDVKRADFYGNKYGTYEVSYQAVRGINTKLSDVFIWTGVTNAPPTSPRSLRCAASRRQRSVPG